MEIVSHRNKFGRDLPVYDLPKPELPNGGRVCIIYSLFIGNDFEPESDYYTYLINSAFWSAHAWRVNSNLLKKKGNIYFHVERRLYEQSTVRSQFEIANLTDAVILFDVPQGDATYRKYGIKLYATLCPEFDNYERAYHIDADTFLCRRENASLIDVQRINNVGEDESLLNLFLIDPVPDFKLMPPPYFHMEREKAEALLKHHLEDYLGVPLTHGYRCWGGIFAWNPQKLCEDFKEMVRRLTPTVCNDEMQFAIYSIKTNRINTRLGHLWENLKLVGNFYNNFMKNTTPPHFFEHAVIDPNEPEFDKAAWIEKWYSHIGIHRR